MTKQLITILFIAISATIVALNFNFADDTRPLIVGKVTTQIAMAYTFPLSEDRPIHARSSQLLQAQNDYNLAIPSLGINAPIILEPSTNFNNIYKSLEGGVVHYSKTAKPGEQGVSVILGHSSYPRSYNGSYGTIFDSLDTLKNGDNIHIKKIDGSILNYKVSKSLIISPDNYSSSELADLETTNSSSIVLMSCWPVGTAQKRIAIKADLL
jgi:LPXTG-site transpeptidase (sortase) family protein